MNNGTQLAQGMWVPEELASGQDSATLLEALFDGHPDMVIMVDMEGRIVAANAQALEGFSYTREQLEGQLIGMLLPEKARARHAEYVAEFMRRPMWRTMHSGLDLSARDANGVEFQVDVMLRPFFARGRQFGMAILRRLDTALTRSRAQVRALTESLEDYSINLLDAQGRILTWNEGSRRIHGLTASEALGKHVSILYRAEEMENGTPASLLKEAEQMGRCRREGWWRGPNGLTIWAEIDLCALRDDTGRLSGFTRVLHDLSHYKQAEDELRALNAQLDRYRIIVENVEDYALYTLDAEGRIDSWGAGAQKVIGYATEEVLGRHYSMFSTAEDRENGIPEKQLEEAARAGRCATDNWRIARDGSMEWSSGVLTAVRDDAGVLTGFIRVARAMTRQKKLEESLARLNAELEERVAERTSLLEATVTQLQQKNQEAENYSRMVSTELKEKEVLLREIHHRVKNNLQVIQSLRSLGLTLKEIQVLTTRYRGRSDKPTDGLLQEQLARSLARIETQISTLQATRQRILEFRAALSGAPGRPAPSALVQLLESDPRRGTEHPPS